MVKVLNKTATKHNLMTGITASIPTVLMTNPNVAMAAPNGAIGDNDRVNIGSGVNVEGRLNNTSAAGPKALTMILGRIRLFVLGFAGFGVLAMLASFTLHALELALSAGNPQNRPKHVQSLGIDFAVMAVLGALSWIAGLAYNFIGE